MANRAVSPWEVRKMIVGPNKGVFFVATVLMYAASVYGAESFSATDPMTRIFVGEPHQLTLPPGFHDAIAAPAPSGDCAPRLGDVDVPDGQSIEDPMPDAQRCAALPAKTPADAQSEPPTAESAKARVIAQPASAAPTIARP